MNGNLEIYIAPLHAVLNSSHLYTCMYRIPWKFRGRKVSWFSCFSHIRKTFLYESSRCHCSSMNLRESMRDSAKVFSWRSVCTTCRETFLPQNFHGTYMSYTQPNQVSMCTLNTTHTTKEMLIVCLHCTLLNT